MNLTSPAGGDHPDGMPHFTDKGILALFGDALASLEATPEAKDGAVEAEETSDLRNLQNGKFIALHPGSDFEIKIRGRIIHIAYIEDAWLFKLKSTSSTVQIPQEDLHGYACVLAKNAQGGDILVFLDTAEMITPQDLTPLPHTELLSQGKYTWASLVQTLTDHRKGPFLLLEGGALFFWMELIHMLELARVSHHTAHLPNANFLCEIISTIIVSELAPTHKVAPRNTCKKAVSEVPRAREVAYIGDLHGRKEGFDANAQDVGIIDQAGRWTGENTHCVLVGDILGDRHTQGIPIYSALGQLQAQAHDKGGCMTWLAGNHEDFVIGLFTDGRHVDDDVIKDSIEPIRGKLQGKGVFEFFKYINGGKIPQSVDEIRGISRQKALDAMRDDEEGRSILGLMCQMQICEQIDDTLYIHCEPSVAMVDFLLKHGTNLQKGIDYVNTIFQTNLHKRLMGNCPPEDLAQDFYLIRRVFLDTNNGSAPGGNGLFNADQAKILQAQGINRIVHGHRDYVRNIVTSRAQITQIGGIEIVSCDYSSWKWDGLEGLRSFGKITKNGDRIPTRHKL